LCNGHRNPNSGNPISIPTIAVGGKIQVTDVNYLKDKINTEIAAWNSWLTQNSQGGEANTGNLGAVDEETQITATGGLSTGAIPQINVLNSALAQIDEWTQNNTTQTNGPGNATGPFYPNPYTGSPAQTLAQYKGGQANNPGATVGVGNKITAAQWQAIISSYNTITQDCICNSDCACNAVCACYNDCGCNYSDERLKTNIILVDVIDGINVYEFNYAWNPTKTYRGVMAQELLNTKYRSAVTKDTSGFYKVDYAQLPVKMEEVSLCTE
jgi:hypothetical protein